MSHFLSTVRSAIAWALKNVGDAREDYPTGRSPWAENHRERKESEVSDYAHEFAAVNRAGGARVWRAVEIPAAADPRQAIDWTQAGTHWSFRPTGAGVYSGGKVHEPTKTVVIEATVKADAIDWPYSFTSFWYYPEQFECALKPGAEVQVVAIDGVPFGRSVRANGTDERMRDLERRAAQGDPQAQDALRAAQRRQHDLPGELTINKLPPADAYHGGVVALHYEHRVHNPHYPDLTAGVFADVYALANPRKKQLVGRWSGRRRIMASVGARGWHVDGYAELPVAGRTMVHLPHGPYVTQEDTSGRTFPTAHEAIEWVIPVIRELEAAVERAQTGFPHIGLPSMGLPPQQNPAGDDRLRQLERAAAAGDVQALLAAAREAVRTRQDRMVMERLLPLAMETGDQDVIEEVASAYWHARGAFDPRPPCATCGAESLQSSFGWEHFGGQPICEPCWDKAWKAAQDAAQKNPHSSWRLVSVKPSRSAGKKWTAVFEDRVTGSPRTTHFGASGYSDFTMHKDPARRDRYLERHGRGREDWSDPTTPGALSRWLLWNKPTFEASLSDFRRKFGANPQTPPPIKWENVHLDNHSGQDDLVLIARDPASRELLGHLHYTIFRGKIHINLVETEDKHRRKGVAFALLTQLATIHPTLPILPGVRTAMGEPLWQSFARPRRQKRRQAEAAARRGRRARSNPGDSDMRAVERAALQGDQAAEQKLKVWLARLGCPHGYLFGERSTSVVGPPCEIDLCPISRKVQSLPPEIRAAHLTAVMHSGHEWEPDAVYTAYYAPGERSPSSPGEWVISDNLDREGLVPVITRRDDGTWWQRTWDGDVPLGGSSPDGRTVSTLPADPLEALRTGWSRHRKRMLWLQQENPPVRRNGMDERLRGSEREARRSGAPEDEVRLLVERMRAGEVDPEVVALAAVLGDEASRLVVPSWREEIRPTWRVGLAADAQAVLRPAHVNYVLNQLRFALGDQRIAAEVFERSLQRQPGASAGWANARLVAAEHARHGDWARALDEARLLATFSFATSREVWRARDWQHDPEGPQTRAWAAELQAQAADLIALLTGRPLPA